MFESARVIAHYEGLKRGGPFNIESTENPIPHCCGTAFDVGSPRIVATEAAPDSQSLARIEAEMEKTESEREAQLELTIVPLEDSSMEIVFPKWLSS
jgi:hypothetical protein